LRDAISLGIDLGTSEVKAALLGDDGVVLAHSGVEIPISRPRSGWSEQNPADWWEACVAALSRLRAERPAEYSRVRCIGLSGQMHGAVLLDKRDQCIRPVMLWNDSRASAEAEWLNQNHPSFAAITGSLAMAGFTAPKLLWLKAHEPAAFGAVDCVMLPKDYLRLKLTGERITDMSDAAGTLWLDVPNRRWYAPLIAATGLDPRQLPHLVEGSDAAGKITASVARALGLPDNVIVAGGGGDNPASGVGIGAANSGQSFISLGTSATIVSITEKAVGNPAAGVHGFCHALPNRWYAMGVILSGASCLKWITSVLSISSEQALLALIEKGMPIDQPVPQGSPMFLPYLSGERTPHNDPLARGMFVNLAHDTSTVTLGYAVLEGVGFALRDALHSVESAGAVVSKCSLVGGGARSTYWAQLLANILGIELHTLSGSELSGCIGGAKLGYLASGYGSEILALGVSEKAVFRPHPSQKAVLQDRYEKYRCLYPAFKQWYLQR
jgi:xylulokinase